MTNDFGSFDLNDNQVLDSIWADYYEDGADMSKAFRPVRSRQPFTASMDALNCSLLIRGHDPRSPLVMYDKRCVTMQTNRYYKDYCGIHIAIVDLSKEINDASDIEIINLEKEGHLID